MRKPLLLVTALLVSLASCDQINNVINKPAREAKATGAACRLSGRSLEECYRRNPRAGRADVYAGWREMNDYMAAKNIQAIAPPADDAAPVDAPAKAAEDKKPADTAADAPGGNKKDGKAE